MSLVLTVLYPTTPPYTVPTVLPHTPGRTPQQMRRDRDAVRTQSRQHRPRPKRRPQQITSVARARIRRALAPRVRASCVRSRLPRQRVCLLRGRRPHAALRLCRAGSRSVVPQRPRKQLVVASVRAWMVCRVVVAWRVALPVHNRVGGIRRALVHRLSRLWSQVVRAGLPRRACPQLGMPAHLRGLLLDACRLECRARVAPQTHR